MAQEIKSQQSGKKFRMENDGNASLTLATGKYLTFGAWRFYTFTTAITANVTTTDAPAGALARTSNATGRNSIFVSDGTKFQFLTNA